MGRGRRVAWSACSFDERHGEVRFPFERLLDGRARLVDPTEAGERGAQHRMGIIAAAAGQAYGAFGPYQGFLVIIHQYACNRVNDRGRPVQWIARTQAQGHFLSKPVPAAELIDWLENREPVSYAERRKTKRAFAKKA